MQVDPIGYEDNNTRSVAEEAVGQTCMDIQEMIR